MERWTSGTIPTNLNKARTSYNSAITTLNNAANNYLNTTYASSARCVGSVPNNKNSETTTYFDGPYIFDLQNLKAKDEDSNHTTDVNQMTKLGIINIGTNYWLASRDTGHYENGDYFFNIKAIYSNGSMIGSNHSGDLMLLGFTGSIPGQDYSYNWSYGLRPVFTLKNTVKVTGGSGTSSSPYTLGT